MENNLVEKSTIIHQFVKCRHDIERMADKGIDAIIGYLSTIIDDAQPFVIDKSNYAQGFNDAREILCGYNSPDKEPQIDENTEIQYCIIAYEFKKPLMDKGIMYAISKYKNGRFTVLDTMPHINILGWQYLNPFTRNKDIDCMGV